MSTALPVMRDAQNKMSKRHGDPSYEDLKAEGYLTEAILNYVALLGWSPKGELAEQEIFTLPELVNAFDITGISKSPAIFDRPSWITSTPSICGAWPPRRFAKVSEPYIRQTVTDSIRHRRHRRTAFAGPLREAHGDPREGGLLRAPAPTTAWTSSPIRNPKRTPRSARLCWRPPFPCWRRCLSGRTRPSTTGW